MTSGSFAGSYVEMIRLLDQTCHNFRTLSVRNPRNSVTKNPLFPRNILTPVPRNNVARYNPDAMFNLAVLYEKGWGVAQDYGKAREWYQKVADAGNADAMYNLGLLYQNGWGVAQDDAKAREWFQRGADAGNVSAKRKILELGSPAGSK
jgi:TPR repeat protein